jgi:hypothetical protein
MLYGPFPSIYVAWHLQDFSHLQDLQDFHHWALQDLINTLSKYLSIMKNSAKCSIAWSGSMDELAVIQITPS